MFIQGHVPNDFVGRAIRAGLRLVVLMAAGLLCLAIVDRTGPEISKQPAGLRLGLIAQYQLGGQVWALAFSADNQYLASATITAEVTLNDLINGRVSRLQQDGPLGSTRSLAFSPRGRVLAFASGEPAVRFWDLDSQAESAALETGGEPVRWLAFSPDGAMLAIGEWMGAEGRRVVSVWDWKNGRRLALLDAFCSGINALAFAPDGTQLAVGDSSGAVTLWDTRRWCASAKFQAHASAPGGACSLAFAPTGGVLATAGASDRNVRLWDATEGKLLMTLTATGCVGALGFSPDGTLLATAQDDGYVGVWEYAAGRRLASIPTDDRALHSLAFSGDGRLLATGSLDGVVRLWDFRRALHSDSLQLEICKLTTCR